MSHCTRRKEASSAKNWRSGARSEGVLPKQEAATAVLHAMQSTREVQTCDGLPGCTHLPVSAALQGGSHTGARRVAQLRAVLFLR